MGQAALGAEVGCLLLGHGQARGWWHAAHWFHVPTCCKVAPAHRGPLPPVRWACAAVQVPAKSTSYICMFMQMPGDPNVKQHVVGYTPLFGPTVHHMDIYACDKGLPESATKASVARGKYGRGWDEGVVLPSQQQRLEVDSSQDKSQRPSCALRLCCIFTHHISRVSPSDPRW